MIITMLGKSMKWATLSLLGLMVTPMEAKVWMPKMFQDGMVLQRGKPMAIWGTADPKELVTVTFKKKGYQTTADEKGQWRITLPATKAGGPYALTVNEQTINDVMIGDVWLCSGQSNIDVDIERVYPQYPDEIDAYSNPNIRLFRVQTMTNTHGHSKDVKATEWRKLDKKNAWKFSAVGYFLAKRMYEQTGVPQGIICNSLGGTPIEAWIEADSLRKDFPHYVAQTAFYQDDEMVAAWAKANQLSSNRWNKLLDDNDPGLKEGWNTLNYNDKGWRKVNQYEPLVKGISYVGSLWLRKHIHVDAAHAGKSARLLLGTLYDMDYTFVNGKEVGRTYYQYPPRRYQIPEGLLKEGDNVITVRFINKNGVPHFIKEKPYQLIFAPGDTLKLDEQWVIAEGQTMPNCPGGGPSIQNLPSTLYNAMLYPLHPYTLAGVVWYQGESNVGKAGEYGDLLRLMLNNWRAVMEQPELPFAIVQLANFMQPTELPQNSQWARLREAQRTVAAQDERAELVVAIDLGETVDIHPLRKKEVAQRIGLAFDRLVGKKKVTLSPAVIKKEVNGETIVLTFDQPLRQTTLNEFELAGADGRFYNAEAEAKGTQVVVRCPQVKQPQRVRYAWKNNPIKANCYGINGLPASSFEY